MTRNFARILFSALTVILCSRAAAQPVESIDGIIGDDIILRSEVEAQVQYFTQSGEKDDGTLPCRVLEKLIIEKLLLNKALQDSLVVGEDEVEADLESRIEDFIRTYQGIENLEKEYGKPLVEIREDLRPEVRNQLLIQKQRNAIFSKIQVTPRDVEKFYNSIPKDSLPYMPAQVEIFHLAAKPGYSDEALAKAKKEMEDTRQRIITGSTTFVKEAKNSDDTESAKKEGMLGEFGRGQMVPEFEEVAFSTREGEISEVFQTEYGFHILKVHKRIGERVTASHILVKPVHEPEDYEKARDEVEKYLRAIRSDSITFEQAAQKWSDDPSSRNCGGCLRNPQTGENRIPLDVLDVEFFFKVDKLKEGQISEVHEWMMPGNERGFHIIYLKKRIPPHVLSLKEDYQQVSNAATQSKQFEALEKWFLDAKKNIFIEIKREDCLSVLKHWLE